MGERTGLQHDRKSEQEIAAGTTIDGIRREADHVELTTVTGGITSLRARRQEEKLCCCPEGGKGDTAVRSPRVRRNSSENPGAATTVTSSVDKTY